MALKRAASRWSPSLTPFLKPNPASSWRCFAKPLPVAASVKTATPNAAKAAKAKGNPTKKEEKKEQRERFKDLIDACLTAPTPVKVSSGEEYRKRLLLLEKKTLATVSPDLAGQIILERTRAKDAQTKRQSGDENPAAAESVLQTDENPSAAENLLQTEETGSGFELTAEDLAKESSRVLLAEHRERAKGESIRLQLQKEAIAALPQHLKEAALVPDLTPFPKSRIPASFTPPIRGYIDDQASAAAQAVTVKKSR